MLSGMGQSPEKSGPGAVSLLLVEDDRELALLLTRLFTAEGFAVHTAGDVRSGLHAGLTAGAAVMVVDRRLPDGDGVELVTRLRQRGIATPALILTAHGTVQDRVEGLNGGADDYLVKPFDSSELLARVHALLRRHLDTAVVLPLGSANLHVESLEVELPDGSRVALSPAEGALLMQLARRPSRIFSREELRENLAPGTMSTSLVDTYVYALRRKLGRSAVRTVRGIGYRAGDVE